MKKTTKYLAAVLLVAVLALVTVLATNGGSLQGLLVKKITLRTDTDVSLGALQPKGLEVVFSTTEDNFLGSFKVCTTNDSFDLTRINFTLIGDPYWLKNGINYKFVDGKQTLGLSSSISNMHLDKNQCKTFNLNVNMEGRVRNDQSNHIITARIDKLYSGNWAIDTYDLPLKGVDVNFIND